MVFAQTAIRYLQRHGFYSTQLNYGRYQLGFLKTHRRPVGIPIIPKLHGNINNQKTSAWPTYVS